MGPGTNGRSPDRGRTRPGRSPPPRPGRRGSAAEGLQGDDPPTQESHIFDTHLGPLGFGGGRPTFCKRRVGGELHRRITVYLFAALRDPPAPSHGPWASYLCGARSHHLRPGIHSVWPVDSLGRQLFSLSNLRAGGADRGPEGVHHAAAHPDDAQRRQHAPHPRPHRGHHRGPDLHPPPAPPKDPCQAIFTADRSCGCLLRPGTTPSSERLQRPWE